MKALSLSRMRDDTRKEDPASWPQMQIVSARTSTHKKRQVTKTQRHMQFEEDSLAADYVTSICPPQIAPYLVRCLLRHAGSSQLLRQSVLSLVPLGHALVHHLRPLSLPFEPLLNRHEGVAVSIFSDKSNDEGEADLR